MRERLLQYSYENKLSHIGSNLTALPIIEQIYRLKKPDEKFVLSSGHAHLAHAIVKEERGLGGIEDLMIAGIHCDKINDCDVSTGSLGIGISIAVGLALASRDRKVYTLISDGECLEGVVWESLRVASELGLNNLVVYVNSNSWGAYGKIDQDLLEKRLKMFFPVIFIRTNSDFGETKELDAHYHVLSEDEYENLKK